MKALVLTSSGVEECPVLDPSKVNDLATWLCNTNDYHDRADSWASKCKEDSMAVYRRHEAQCKANGGYCNTCRDFAGLLLSEFNLTARDESA